MFLALKCTSAMSRTHVLTNEPYEVYAVSLACPLFIAHVLSVLKVCMR